MKKILCIALLLCLCLSLCSFDYPDPEIKSLAESKNDSTVLQPTFSVNCKGAVLMEASTGKILFEQDMNYTGSPASVTKVMTLLLVMEALDAGKIRTEDKVAVSAYAASMGGSQVFLEEGEEFTIEDLVKCTVISSANDAAVALAETVGGSEEAFVSMMNARATELGLGDTHFENVTGLDDTTTDHRTSARDIAVMSRELIRHPLILKYSSLWQDSIRDGAFTLTNTNRLVRFYRGCNGLKTGSTSKAGYCVSTTAERDGMTLIAVVMGAPSRDERNDIARTLLDFGFSSFAVYRHGGGRADTLPVPGGTVNEVSVTEAPFAVIVEKGKADRVEVTYDLPAELPAPVRAGQQIGSVTYTLDGEVIGKGAVTADADVPKITFREILFRMFRHILTGDAG